MCAVLKVSRSGYYAWQKRKYRVPKQTQLAEHVQATFSRNRGMYGSPRIAIELQEKGMSVSRSTIARTMSKLGLTARPKRKFVHTTHSDHSGKVAANLLNRDFTAQQPNEKWVSDITYIWTKKSWVYLTIIIDLFDRMVVGWSVSSDLSSQNTVIKAFNLAVGRRAINQPLVFHSDRGIQYAATHFQQVLSRYPTISQSMSRKGNCWDNAIAESFFKTIKTEWTKQFKYQNVEDVQRSVFDYIERWYNTQRRHSAIGYVSPKKKYQLFFNPKAA